MNQSIYQTREWAEVCEKSRRWKPIFINNLVLFERQISLPLIGDKKIIFGEGIKPNKEDILLIRQEVNSRKPFYSLIVPKFNKVISESKMHQVQNNTLIISLAKPLEELWQNLEKKSIRWGIKKSIREGVIVKQVNSEQELKDFYTIYSETCKEGGIDSESYNFFLNSYHLLQPNGLAKILVAKKGEEIVSGAIILISGDYVTLNLTGTSQKGQELQANPLVYWRIIEISKGLKKDWLDLGGFDLESNKGSKTYLINKFKERLGGEVVPQNVYTFDLKYLVVRTLAQKFGWIKKLVRARSKINER